MILRVSPNTNVFSREIARQIAICNIKFSLFHLNPAKYLCLSLKKCHKYWYSPSEKLLISVSSLEALQNRLKRNTRRPIIFVCTVLYGRPFKDRCCGVSISCTYNQSCEWATVLPVCQNVPDSKTAAFRACEKNVIYYALYIHTYILGI